MLLASCVFVSPPCRPGQRGAEWNPNKYRESYPEPIPPQGDKPFDVRDKHNLALLDFLATAPAERKKAVELSGEIQSIINTEPTLSEALLLDTLKRSKALQSPEEQVADFIGAL